MLDEDHASSPGVMIFTAWIFEPPNKGDIMIPDAEEPIHYNLVPLNAVP
jgi:hypothetical protein